MFASADAAPPVLVSAAGSGVGATGGSGSDVKTRTKKS